MYEQVLKSQIARNQITIKAVTQVKADEYSTQEINNSLVNSKSFILRSNNNPNNDPWKWYQSDGDEFRFCLNEFPDLQQEIEAHRLREQQNQSKAQSFSSEKNFKCCLQIFKLTHGGLHQIKIIEQNDAEGADKLDIWYV